MFREDTDPAHDRANQKYNNEPGGPGAPFHNRTGQPNQGGIENKMEKVGMQEGRGQEPPVFAVKLCIVGQGPETEQTCSVIDCAPGDLDSKTIAIAQKSKVEPGLVRMTD